MKQEISRRSFVKAGSIAAGATIGASLVGCSSSSEAETTQSTTESITESTSESTTEEYTISETRDTDILVIGSGTAGSVSAICAAKEGAQVTVIEKLPAIGGAAASAASIFSVNSKFQNDLGVEANLEEIIAEGPDWNKNNIDANLWRRFVSTTGEDVDWYREELGVQLAPCVFGDMLVPWTVLYVEDESQENDIDTADGSYGVAVKNKVMEDLGVETIASCPAVKLVMDGERVVGAIAKNKDGEYIQFNAKNTILACGSFGASDEKIYELTKQDPSKLEYRGYPGSTGDGHDMALAAGGYSTGNYSVGKEGGAAAGMPLASSVNILAAMQPARLWVNQNAERFINEFGNDYGQDGNAVLAQGRAYCIIDSDIIAYYQENGMMAGFADVVPAGVKYDDIVGDLEAAMSDHPEFIFKADSIEELAEQIDIEPEALKNTVDNYNAACVAGEDTEYGKDPMALIPLGNGPFYAVRLHSNNVNCLGGVRTNYDMQCVDSEHMPVPGLYCAGTEVEGFESTTYNIALAGTCQAICIYTGRIAGTHAAQNM